MDHRSTLFPENVVIHAFVTVSLGVLFCSLFSFLLFYILFSQGRLKMRLKSNFCVWFLASTDFLGISQLLRQSNKARASANIVLGAYNVLVTLPSSEILTL